MSFTVDARRCAIATFVVPVTSTFAAGRRTSGAINNFDRASATTRCLRPWRNNICRSCSNIFPRARFYFHRRSSDPAFIMERAVKHTPPPTSFNPLLVLPFTYSRPRGIKLSIWICIVWTKHRETILVCVIQKWETKDVNHYENGIVDFTANIFFFLIALSVSVQMIAKCTTYNIQHTQNRIRLHIEKWHSNKSVMKVTKVSIKHKRNICKFIQSCSSCCGNVWDKRKDQFDCVLKWLNHSSLN